VAAFPQDGSGQATYLPLSSGSPQNGYQKVSANPEEGISMSTRIKLAAAGGTLGQSLIWD
jgi:hypothetical protein